MRRSTSKSSNMGQCKKHPRHKQSPGVCSLCLAEKLTRVSATSSSSSRDRYMSSRARSYYYCSSSSVSSSEDESSYPSSTASPRNEEIVGHRRILSEVNMKSQFAGTWMSKSKSMVGSSNEQGVKLREEKKKVKGFWAKLIRLRKNDQNRMKNADDHEHRKKVLMLSQSMPLAASSSTMVVY